MESHCLERASQYLNSLLLARGLLSNGKPIDFALPDRHGHGTDATMSRVINLIHDLVLRRDQDADQRESLAINLRAARADEARRVLDLQRLQDKHAELVRDAASAESQERTLKTAVRKAEAQAKELKEQMLKMKSTLDQVRAKCLTDVRKRDAELDKLKAHLAGMQRGKTESGGMKINVINWEPEVKGREMRNGQDVNSGEWSLEKETNDFLAALVNETSTENVSLRRIITDTMEILRELTGLEQDSHVEEENEEDDGIGIPRQYRKSRRKAPQQPETLASCADLAEQMNAILEHCQSILKDPSFVPIEEVQIRDEEIVKLRRGWEKMATRWKEAVTMMDNWRRRMVENGEGFSATDFSSLEFGKSVAKLPNGQPVFGAEEELSSMLYENSTLEEEEQVEEAMNEDNLEVAQGDMADEELQESDLDIPPEPGLSPKRRASIARKAGLNIGKPTRPLQAIDRNLRSPTRVAGAEAPSRKSADSGIGSLDGENDAPEVKLQSRIPRKATAAEEPALTVSEKLAAVEAEAVEARQRSPSTGAKKRKHTGTHRTKRTARRRSTLSPEELAVLMGIE